MEIKIEQEKVQAIISQAILKELGENQRDMLIAQAIEYLLKEQASGSGYSSTKFIPLHQAFNSAVAHSAQKVARELVENDEQIQAKLKALLTEAMEKVFNEKRETMVDSMAAAFIKGFDSNYR
jgi:uncharacterized membrane-anchored protein YjiN (DUF445 family)